MYMQHVVLAIIALLLLLLIRNHGLFYCPGTLESMNTRMYWAANFQLVLSNLSNCGREVMNRISIHINSGSWCEVAKRALSYISSSYTANIILLL